MMLLGRSWLPRELIRNAMCPDEELKRQMRWLPAWFSGLEKRVSFFEELSSWRFFRFWATRILVVLLSLTGVGHAAPETLNEAWRLSQTGEFHAAEQAFREAAGKGNLSDEEKLWALYGQAYCWNYRPDGRDGEKARALYQQIIDRAPPENPLVAWSDFESVQSEYFEIPYEKRDDSALAETYLEVYKRHPESRAGQEAYVTYLILRKLAQKSDGEGIIQQAEKFVQDHPDSPWLSRVYALMADCYGDLGQSRAKLDSLIRALESVKAGETGADVDYSTAYWNVAYVSEFELGDFELARQYYHKLITEYPRDSRLFIAKKALQRMDSVESSLRQGKPLSGGGPR